MFSNNREIILNSISYQFPINKLDMTFPELFPFCNEVGYAKLQGHTGGRPRALTDDKAETIRAASGRQNVP